MLPTAAMRMADVAFHHAYPMYRVLYAAWKRVVDRRERRFMHAVIRPGMIVMDVGANIGIYTQFLSRRVGNAGQVHAFEPAPQNCRRLLESVRHLNNVRVHQAAASDRTGELVLHLSDENNADHRVFDSGDGRKSLRVACTQLDDCIDPGRPVDFIKMDVQGHELHVLRGAQRILSESPRLRILVEFWPFGLVRAGTEPESMLKECHDLGLVVEGSPFGRTDVSDLLRMDRDDPNQYCNVVLFRECAPRRHPFDSRRA